MLRNIIFRNMANGAEMNMPVTPESFEINHGINVETVNINGIGDVNLAGCGTLATIKVDFLFPAQKYPFVTINNLPEPYAYVRTFTRFIDEHTLVRLIVSGTSVNIPVIFESIDYSEKDGTNDVYATINMREYRELQAVKVQSNSSASNNKARSAPATPANSKSYTIKKGDTLSAICQKYYGNASLYSKLATANGIKNPNLIYSGTTIKIPAKGQL